LLGNGKDVSQLAFNNQVAPPLLPAILFLKPATIVLCMISGAPEERLRLP
jgi:H+/Cl- antiporter ClcA